MDIVIEFGKLLKSLREKNGLSTHRLAELTGVSQSYISHLENGRKKNVPSPEILKKLSEALGVSYFDLMALAGYYSEDDLLEPIEDIQRELPKRISPLTRKIVKRPAGVVDIIEILEKKQVLYNDKLLSKDDRNRIIEMIKVMFPRGKNEKEEN